MIVIYYYFCSIFCGVGLGKKVMLLGMWCYVFFYVISFSFYNDYFIVVDVVKVLMW